MIPTRLPGTGRLGAWVLAAILVGGMLVFDPWGWAAFGPAKWGAVSVTGLLTIVVALTAPTISVHRVSAIGSAAFILWAGIVGLVAVDPVHTWIGTPDRHWGFFAVALAAVAFLVGQQVRDTVDVALVLRASVVSLFGIGMYSMLEVLGVPPVDLTFAGGRLGGPFGTPAYLGAACALLVPIAIAMSLDAAEARMWRGLAAAATVLGVVAAVGSQTRGAWVGLAVAAVVAGAAIRPTRSTSRWLAVGLTATVLVVVAISPLGDRFASTFDSGGGAQGRVDEWEVGVRALGAHALTGTGFEGYRVVFGEHVDVEYERRYGREVIPDRAHNGAIDVGVATGIPGLIFYLAAASLGAVRAWRGLRSGRPWLIGLSAGLLGYLVQQQFLFPIAEVDIAFWGLVGVLVMATEQGERTVSLRAPRATGLAALVLVGAALVAGGLDVAADRQVKRALSEASTGVPTPALAAVNRATDLRPDSIRYWFSAATVVARSGLPGAFDGALERLQRGLDISPGDPILLRERASVLLRKARVTGGSADGTAAITAWVSLITRDPNNAGYLLEMGVAYAAAGQSVEAEAAWLNAADLAPRSAAPWSNLALLYLELGRGQEAEAALRLAEATDPGYPGLDELRNRIAAEVVK